jgi:hypothetical protein
VVCIGGCISLHISRLVLVIFSEPDIDLDMIMADPTKDPRMSARPSSTEGNENEKPAYASCIVKILCLVYNPL